MRFSGRLRGYDVLRNRNYRIFWSGQWVSLIGTWMQQIVQAWLLARLTESPFALGLLGAASAAPMLVLVLFGGLVSDRFNRQRILLTTQTLSMIQASILAALTLSGAIQPWHIIALAAVLGAINAFDIPARQAFIVELVGPTYLPNAIALNSSGFNAARVAGPAIGGFLVAAFGEGVCFLINAASYLAVLAGLWMLRVEFGRRPRQFRREPGSLVAGLRYAGAHRQLRWVLGVVGVVSAVSINYRHFLPTMAQVVLGVGAWRYGLLMAAAGIGAGAGALTLAGLQIRRENYYRLLPVGLALFGVSLFGFGLARDYGVSLILLVLAGIGGIIYFNASNTLVQLTVDDDYRGRVMSVYTLMHQGTATFGSLGLGILAEGYGSPSAFLAGGVVALAAGGVFFMRLRVLSPGAVASQPVDNV